MIFTVQLVLNLFQPFYAHFQKNELIAPLEPSIFTRDIQNNIRVSVTVHLHAPSICTNIFIVAPLLK